MTNKVVEILLDNYPGMYHPGQTILGRVQCTFFEEECNCALEIRFNGKAETEWTESESYYDEFFKEQRTRNVTYSDREVYFAATYNLTQDGNNSEVPAGVHMHPFSFVLPQHLPSSFEGPCGNIRYTVEVVANRKFRSDNVKNINIVSPLDLNLLPELREPVAISVDKTPCSCWCKNSGPITFNLSLPATGFVPGQTINVGTYVENMSNLTVEQVKFKIYSEIRYKAPGNSKYEEDSIAECREGAIGAHSEKSWTSSLILSENRSFPNLTTCSIIKLEYSLRGEVVLPMPHTNLNARTNLVIGTVPLSGVNLSLPGPPPGSNSYAYNPTAPSIDEAALPNPSAPHSEGDFLNYSADTEGITPYLPSAGAPGVSNLNEGARQGMPGWSIPADPSKSEVPPSYEEAQKLKQKNGKPE